MNTSTEKILIIESFTKRASLIKDSLEKEDLNISIVSTGKEAKKKLKLMNYSLVLLQCAPLDNSHSLDLLIYIKKIYPETIVIIMSDQFSRGFAIQASRKGAYDFIDNETTLEEINNIVKKSLERRKLGIKNKQLFFELKQKNDQLEWRVKEFSVLYEISKIIATQPSLDEALKGLFALIQRVIPIDYFLCLSFNTDIQSFHLRFAQGVETDIIKRLDFTEVKIEPYIEGKTNREDMIQYYTKGIFQFLQKNEFYKLLSESFLAIPIIIEKDLYGIFVVGSNQKNIFLEEQRQLLSIVASQALSLYEKASRLMQSTQLITMGQLTSEIAHDLRHPITIIKGALQNLENKWYDDNFRQKSLEVVNNGIFKLNELIKELLTFSNPNRFPLKTVDVNETLRKVLILVQNDLLRHKIDLVQEISIIPPIQINEERIKEVFLNLIINAIESMENGGILKISTQKAKKRFNTSKSYVQIDFSDNGVGIKLENQKKIFDHFFSTKKTGIGLGLAIVNRIIKTHNGFIEVVSEEGKGSVFSIYLPIEKGC